MSQLFSIERTRCISRGVPLLTTRFRGVYFAKWRKVNNQWMLLAEVFVQTNCTGPRYCNTPPAQ